MAQLSESPHRGEQIFKFPCAAFILFNFLGLRSAAAFPTFFQLLASPQVAPKAVPQTFSAVPQAAPQGIPQAQRLPAVTVLASPQKAPLVLQVAPQAAPQAAPKAITPTTVQSVAVRSIPTPMFKLQLATSPVIPQAVAKAAATTTKPLPVVQAAGVAVAIPAMTAPTAAPAVQPPPKPATVAVAMPASTSVASQSAALPPTAAPPRVVRTEAPIQAKDAIKATLPGSWPSAPARPPVTVTAPLGTNASGSSVGTSPIGTGILPLPLQPYWASFERAAPQLAQLLTEVTFAVIIKALCMAGNVLVQVSPYPQVQRWEIRGSTGEADSAPYLSIAFGGWQWCFYGLFAWLLTKRSGFLILVHSNILGALLGTYYTVAFYRHCRNEYSLTSLNLYLSAVAALALLQFCTILVLPPERALFLTGLISSFCSFVGALSMLVTVPTVVKNRDSRSIPGRFVCANFACSFVWCICGYLLSDPLVTGPNIVALASCVVCLALKVRYPSDEEKSKEDDSDAMPAFINRRPEHRKLPAGAPTERTPCLAAQQSAARSCGRGIDEEEPSTATSSDEASSARSTIPAAAVAAGAAAASATRAAAAALLQRAGATTAAQASSGLEQERPTDSSSSDGERQPFATCCADGTGGTF